MTLTPDGLLSGIPTSSGDYVIQIDAANTIGTTPGQSHALRITAPPTFTASTPPSTATINTAYQYTVQASGYPAPTYSVTEQLPDGLTLNPTTGSITGYPRQTQSATFNLIATNTVGQATSDPITITVTPQLAAPSYVVFDLPEDASVDTAFSYTATADGYPAPTFSLTVGTLPPGLTLDPVTGVLAGTPTTAGIYSLQITATNSQGSTSSRTRGLSVQGGPIFTSATPPGSLDINETWLSYQFRAQAEDASAISYSTTGTLPPGVTLSSDGLLSGTPTQSGTFTYSVTATSSSGSTAVGPFTLTIVSLPSIPGNVTAIPGDGQITISWSPSDPGTSPLSFYAIYNADTYQQLNNVDPTITSATIQGLTNGTTYSFSVMACAAGTGCSGFSATATATPQALSDSGNPSTHPPTSPHPTPEEASADRDNTRGSGPKLTTGENTGQLAATGTTRVPANITLAAILTALTGTATLLLTRRRRARNHRLQARYRRSASNNSR